MNRSSLGALSLAVSATALLTCCSGPRKEPSVIAPEVVAEAPGQSIVACDRHIYIGAPVVLWTDDAGYNAYEVDYHFGAPDVIGPKTPRNGDLRYAPGRRNPVTELFEVAPETGTLNELRDALDLFVLHYDVCQTSQQCFEVLHDVRGFSVHFMLDIDGTLYQTMDLRDTAWHAKQANSRSVGVEIANIGAWPLTEEGDEVLALSLIHI